jgi:hypothetical protein
MQTLKKGEFAYQSLVYLGYIIDGGEFKIDLVEVEAIIKWPTPTNVTEGALREHGHTFRSS